MRLEHARILIADDQPDLVDVLAEILALEGAAVRRAYTGAEALARAAEGFDVALVDVGLPDVSGETLVPRLKAAAPGAEVMLITGQSSLEHAIRAVSVGAYKYVLKPFDPEALLAGLERALRQVRSNRAEEALRRTLRQERDFITAVLDNAGALVAVLDRHGRIVRFNRACEALSGYTLDEVRARSFVELFVPEDERAAHDEVVARLEAGGGPVRHEHRWVTRDGTRRVINGTKSALRDESGALTFVVVTGLDSTERRKAETELRRAHEELQQLHGRLGEEHARLLQAEKLSTIGQLSAGIAHEVNNPLGGVMSCFRALRAGTVPPPRLAEYYDTIEEGLQRIATTVRGLLDYARPRPPRREPVDLATVAATSLRLVEPSLRGKGLRLVDELPVGELRAKADRSQLMQALVNVLLNAAHASPPEGRVTLRPARADGRVGVHICDEGPGISPEARSRLGEAFFTTKPEGEGTGLGLSITRGIMRAHGGSVEFQSAEGERGTTVTLWLPAG